MPIRMGPVAPGEWVRVRVTGSPWPVTMSIGDSPATVAFIDNQPTADGHITWVQRRCPPLAPGAYQVVVRTDTETIRGTIRVK